MRKLKSLAILALTMAAYSPSVLAATAPEGVTVYWGASFAGNAVTALESGKKYLIYDANSSQGTSFRYANPSGSTQIPGTVNTNLTGTFDYGAEYVWTAVKTEGEETWQFKNERYGTYIAWTAIVTGNNEFSLTSEPSAYPYTVTFDGTTAKVNSGISYWDGGADYRMVGWSGDGHPYNFFEVSEEIGNNVDYCNYLTRSYIGEELIGDGSTNFGKVPETGVTTENGITTSVSAEDGNLVVTGTLKAEYSCDVTLKNHNSKTYACVVNGSSVQFTSDPTNETAQWTLYSPTADKLQFYMYSKSAKKFVSGVNYNSGNSVTLVDVSDATLLQMIKNEDRTEAIYNASHSADDYYCFNWRSGYLGTWMNSTGAESTPGSHWYTIMSEDVVTANTESGVLTALETAISNAKIAKNSILATDENADITALDALIAEGEEAFIGRDNFAAITEKLTEETNNLLSKYAKAALASALQQANAVCIAHDVPGQLSTQCDENKALVAAIEAAQAVYDNEEATNDDCSAQAEALNEATEALSAALTSATSQTEIFTNGYYKISNKNGRGTLYYNSSYPTYIWSTGKDATSDESIQQWGFVEKDGKYYLYSPVAKKFANLGTGTFQAQSPNLTWCLTENAPAAIELSANDNFAYPAVEISGDGTHMSISNSYAGPVICYYESTDGGVPFIFEWVAEADETIAAEMLDKLDMDKVIDSQIAQINEFEGSEEVGKFSASTKQDAIDALNALKGVDGTTTEAVTAIYDDFLTKFNKPDAAAVYTIKSYHTSDNTYRALYNDNNVLRASLDESIYGKGNYQNWLCTVNDDGTFSFSNTIRDAEGTATDTYIAPKDRASALTVERDPNHYGCVNLKDNANNAYVMVMNAESTATGTVEPANDGEEATTFTYTYYAIDRSTKPTLTNASGQFVFNIVKNGSSSTRIEEVVLESTTDGAIYDLQGRRVAQPTRTGLYIINGVKTFVRK